jgi:hypothetical protein
MKYFSKYFDWQENAGYDNLSYEGIHKRKPNITSSSINSEGSDSIKALAEQVEDLISKE